MFYDWIPFCIMENRALQTQINRLMLKDTVRQKLQFRAAEAVSCFSCVCQAGLHTPDRENLHTIHLQRMRGAAFQHYCLIEHVVRLPD